MRLVLLGAPGSGKGTQGVALAEHFGVPHVSSGDLLRMHVADGTELGLEVAGYVNKGELVPDDLVLRVIGEAVIAAIEFGGYVLDGFPRTLDQAERGYQLAATAGTAAEAAIFLAVSDEVARRRLGARAEGRSDDADPRRDRAAAAAVPRGNRPAARPLRESGDPGHHRRHSATGCGPGGDPARARPAPNAVARWLRGQFVTESRRRREGS